MKRKILLSCLVGIFLLGVTFAKPGDLSLYSSLTGSGQTMGGLRIDLGNSFVTDLSATSTGGKYSYFADIYYGLYGLAFSGDKENGIKTFSVMFAAEQAINENIVLGIAIPLVSRTKNIDEFTYTYIGSWDIYAVLSF